MMRTIKRHSLPLNPGKWDRLNQLALAYNQERDAWLVKLSSVRELDKLASYYNTRNDFTAQGYQSPYGLQAAQWKLALKDSMETLDRHWKALFRKLSPLISRNDHLRDNQKHYCFWLLKDYTRRQALLLRRLPEPSFAISGPERQQAANYLNRILRRHQDPFPRVKNRRSFCTVPGKYKVFTEKGTQYLARMTLEKGCRVTIPLRGQGKIRGNLWIVLHPAQATLTVHYAAAMKPRGPARAPTEEALGFGITALATDSQGFRYGAGLGEILESYSETLTRKERRRNQIAAVARQAQAADQHKKARRIRTYNLGSKKMAAFKARRQAMLANEVNRGLNSFFKTRRPAQLITGDLKRFFSAPGSQSRNRLRSFWIKGLIHERTHFKTLEARCLHQQVNPAFVRQTCPACGFVWEKNRQGDRFKCLFCGYEDAGGRVTALNLLARSHDPEINRATFPVRVRQVLVQQFLRRLECWDFEFPPSRAHWESVSYLCKEWESLRAKAVAAYAQRTVPGWTPETEPSQAPEPGSDPDPVGITS